MLVVSFQFSFGSALPSAHFVYCSLRYPRLSIFNRVSYLSDFVCILSILLGICRLIHFVHILDSEHLC